MSRAVKGANRKSKKRMTKLQSRCASSSFEQKEYFSKLTVNEIKRAIKIKLAM